VRSPEKTKRGRWSLSERARLRDLYGLRDVAVIARELKRPVASVTRMAESLFPPEVKRSGPWTANEVLELKRRLGTSSTEVIARVLGRNVAEVQAQVLDLGRVQRGGAWAREEVAELKRIHGSRTDEDLSRVFGRSVAEVQRFSAELGLAKDKAFMRRLHGQQATRMPRWKAEELEVLRRSYAGESNLEIARRLGRSVKSIVSKAHHLGLEKSPERLSKMGCENVASRYLSS
jgi:hypothetical protein